MFKDFKRIVYVNSWVINIRFSVLLLCKHNTLSTEIIQTF